MAHATGQMIDDLAKAGFPVRILTGEELRRLQRGLREIAHRRRHCIFRQDDLPDGIHCVASGEVLLESIDRDGNQTAFFIAATGDLIGYRSLFADQPHAATARTLSPCRTYFVPAALVHGLIVENPALAREFLRLLARDPGPIAAPLLRNPYIPAASRLSHLILVLGDRFGSRTSGQGFTCSLPVTRTDIAALIGVRRETVARLLQELEQAGILRLDERNIIVSDPEELAAFAASGSPLPT
jgi:CRP-like cAMP-binding protein